MTKFYNMKECFDACGDNDIPFNKECDFNTRNLGMPKKAFNPEYRFMFTMKEILSDKWQIQRAEPKVFSEFQLLSDVHEAFKTTLDNPIIKYTIAKADQNGQLREWLRPEQVELREAIGNFVERTKEGCDLKKFNNLWCKLKEKFENLKPPGQ